MGTLGNQPARDSFRAIDNDVADFFSEWFDGAGPRNIGDVIEAKKALEMERANNIAVQDGDYRIADSLERIADALEKK